MWQKSPLLCPAAPREPAGYLFSPKYQSRNPAAHKARTKLPPYQGGEWNLYEGQLASHCRWPCQGQSTNTPEPKPRLKQQTVIQLVLLAWARLGNLHSGRRISRVFPSIHVHSKCCGLVMLEERNMPPPSTQHLPQGFGKHSGPVKC